MVGTDWADVLSFVIVVFQTGRFTMVELDLVQVMYVWKVNVINDLIE